MVDFSLNFQVDKSFFCWVQFPRSPLSKWPAAKIRMSVVPPRRKICNAKRVRTMQTVAGSVYHWLNGEQKC